MGLRDESTYWILVLLLGLLYSLVNYISKKKQP